MTDKQKTPAEKRLEGLVRAAAKRIEALENWVEELERKEGSRRVYELNQVEGDW